MSELIKSDKRERLLKQFNRDNSIDEKFKKVSSMILEKMKEFDCSVVESKLILEQVFCFADLESNGVDLKELSANPKIISDIFEYCSDFKITGFTIIEESDFIMQSAMIIYSQTKKEDLALFELAASLQFVKNTIDFQKQFVQ